MFFHFAIYFYRFSINSYRFKGILRKNTRNGVSHYAKKSTDLSVLSSGSNGARTRDLSRVRRTLIPAELYFRFQLRFILALSRQESSGRWKKILFTVMTIECSQSVHFIVFYQNDCDGSGVLWCLFLLHCSCRSVFQSTFF